MTITYLDLYNDITGQAWSMFDGEVESVEEFEKSVTTSIQKALNTLWCSYNFPFRAKTMTFKTKNGLAAYNTPNGNIIRKRVKNKMVYAIKTDTDYLTNEPDYETLENMTGEPTSFYLKNDKIYLYPTPDNSYYVNVDYYTIFAAKNAHGIPKATLVNETDYIDIPEKYETLFKSALLPLAMTYAIANETDENYSGYLKQYNDAYEILLNETKGINIDKTIGWR
ncbi:hypothetical protein IJI31_06465 [bacterium]|nr:hypothetical protein [bacterium]